MKKFLKVLAGAAVITGISIYIVRRINTRRRLDRVADNGYETAHDVLYPRKKFRSSKLRYGPVHPRTN